MSNEHITTAFTLYKNIPLDNTYEHTIYFPNKTAQTAYFNSGHRINLMKQQYQRISTNVIRIQKAAEEVMDYNYLKIVNPVSSAVGVSGKPYYCFIVNIEYVNDITCDVTYEVDVMQTFMWDYDLATCFVAREHSETDVAGDNLVPENVELGPLLHELASTEMEYTDYKICVACTFQDDWSDAHGAMYAGIYSGLRLAVFDTAAEVNEFIDGATEDQKSDGIVSIFMVPGDFVAYAGSSPSYSEVSITPKSALYRDDGTEVKNNKLYTYPYNYLMAVSGDAESADFHYEKFDSDTPIFVVNGVMTTTPQIVMSPKGYDGVEGTNYIEKMVYDTFPQCAFNIDSFRAWLAQNQLKINTSMAYAGAKFAAGGSVNWSTPAPWEGTASYQYPSTGYGPPQEMFRQAGRTPTGMQTSAQNAVDLAGTVAMTVAEMYTRAGMPRQARGSQGKGLEVALGLTGWRMYYTFVRPQFATIIDDYFNKYGYQTNKLKTPNISSRPHWNFVKTVGCEFSTNNMPNMYSNAIKRIYDAGITFWKNPAEVGNYTLNNSPVG